MGSYTKWKKAKSKERDDQLLDYVLSWSLEDICNEGLFKDKVERIPESFQSVQKYLQSFVFPLLEEVRAELCSAVEAASSSPFAKVLALKERTSDAALFYDVEVGSWGNRHSHPGKEPYRSLPGDILLFTKAKPEHASDLQRSGRAWALASIAKMSGDDKTDGITASSVKVKVSNDLGVKDQMCKFSCVIFLMNITTNKRIWNALHMSENLEIIQKLLCTKAEELCKLCHMGRNQILEENLCLPSELNVSQCKAIVSSIRKIQCKHTSNVELIWGPPGTGKTRTLSMLLLTLVQLKIRTLTCAPTNAAITEVASRTLKVMRESMEAGGGRDVSVFSVADILLFGNKEKLKVTPDVELVFLDYRTKKLAECFGPVTGWMPCFKSMQELLEGCVSQYDVLCDNQSVNGRRSDGIDARNVDHVSFLQFLREKFRSSASALKTCVSSICTHVPITFIEKCNFDSMVVLVDLLDSFETLLYRDDADSERLKELFSKPESISDSSVYEFGVLCQRKKCIFALRKLRSSLEELKLPTAMNKEAIMNFCFGTASLILCTASNSHKLHSVAMGQLQMLVVDEAAQMKESETLIPLQLPGIKHIVLIGDECQLPAMVHSNVNHEAGFGRSLFERLIVLGHPKQLLDIQYRMHPSISCFPHFKFYQNKVMDAPNVKSEDYTKCYLPGPMFGPYSFINISHGREMLDDRRSRKNMVEVAVVMKLVQLLFNACTASKQTISIGVVSPYSAQIAEIQQRLGLKYENQGNFSVKVRSIDGFQGGEEDVVILSTVRSAGRGSVGFISSPRRTNVALTRARHCLWILGNERSLTNSGSVWEELIHDAKVRGCFFNADEDKALENVILEVKKELNELEDFLTGDSILFKSSRWKVLFSEYFRKSFVKLKTSDMKNLVLLLLTKLSTGWRPRRRNIEVSCESSKRILNKFKVRELYVVCSIDIVKESWYTQALKVWDVLQLEEISSLVKRLDGIFGMHTVDYLNRCEVKCFERDLVVPMTWPASSGVLQYKNLGEVKNEEDLNAVSSDGKSYVEKSKVSDSLLLMKFYSLSSGVAKNLLSYCNGKEIVLPFELTSQEEEVIHFNRSSFILGRSGTGKTTVLTMKLFQNEQLYHIASEGYHEVQSNLSTVAKDDILRQIFVTVSPKLCYTVKQHVSQLQSFACGGKSNSRSSFVGMDEIDDVTQFEDIPDSFVDVPLHSYPLVITFFKFLMMLDGTVGTSFFNRFPYVRQLAHGKSGNTRSLAFQTFIRTKEVTFERFISSYWPHFNTLLTKEVDSSIVFTEIMSVIKGGLLAGEACDGKLSRQDYGSLSESRGSLIIREKREIIYDIFIAYEKKKAVNGEFDVADIVIDLLRRLRNGRYAGDQMHFVYIDEVQDLSMRQISLFKYICQNFSEGFVFSGDTAQTIARGIDFRFEDTRCLFYVEFLGLQRDERDGRKGKGQVSKMFNLTHNFRTHDGVLKLAQSVIDLLYHFFPQSIDVLSPEESLIDGEAPILLEPNNNDNAILSIFHNSSKDGASPVSFGAEQVVLVRDDSSRRIISDYMGKRALVLTIMECKGLEFEDVLLYDFFGSSPLKNQWGVIYEYMEGKDLLDSAHPQSFQRFCLEKHNILCSELKQLYVAVTRTRQRLWICENFEGLSQPMFNYWKKMGLVNVRQLDESFVEEMQVASSREEWKSKGIKLFYEHNYEVATTCFAKAGDTYWESYAKASGLRATADRLQDSNIEKSRIALSQAAEIFQSIDKAELAAHCYFELHDYERAGIIYLEKFGESKLDKAGECFFLAKQYKRAAEVYARANLHAECLDACRAGMFFDMGFLRIQQWREHMAAAVLKKLDEVFLDFFHGAALHYHDHKDTRTMMKFVKSFGSKDSMRDFLRKLNCLDELLSLEKEWGNFLEAAKIAKLKGYVVVEAELYARANLHAECLDACRAGMFFDMGFLYIQQWRQHMAADVLKKLDKVCQDFVHRAALHYHDHKDTKVMMKFVKSFHSRDSMRSFLSTLNYLDELLSLEKEWGNFLEAADIAKQKGDVFIEVDMLDKAGKFREASMIMLWYVFDNSLGPHESRNGFLKQLTNKEMLLGKAKSISLNHSKLFHEFVCREAEILLSGRTINEFPMIGLRFIRFWKRNAPTDVDRRRSYEVDKVEQHLLERCARYYHEHEDNASMMNYVKDFHSAALMRAFLVNLNCLDELLELEKEWGNFLEAADIARMKGYVLLEAEMLEKAKRLREASMLMLWYVFDHTVLGNKRSPLLQLTQKEKLLEEATLIAMNHSDRFYEFVSRGALILSNGKTIDELPVIGLQFIQCWKQDAPRDVHRVTRRYDIQKVEQLVLERCARYSYELKDKPSMMKYVRDFHSIELRRMFLKALKCLDELLMLEVEDGNYLEAAKVAELKGDLIHEADLLEKAGHLEEASKVILWYVLPHSLWESGSKGWPLRQFGKKEELLKRAMSCVENQSDLQREFVCIEANILSNRESSLSELRQYLIASCKHRSLRGQILSIWKILDAHLNSDTLKYEWTNVLVGDTKKNSEDMISQDMISVETLVHFWNFWKEEILNLLENLGKITQEDTSKGSSHWEFCLNYMGVRKHQGDRSDIYLLLDVEAIWVKEIDDRSFERKGSMVGIGVSQLVSIAQSYWSSELFRVGMQVLETLRALQDYTASNNFDIFKQSRLLAQTFEVADFLKEYKIQGNNAFVEEYIIPTVQNFIRLTFPLDWRKSLTEDMILLRGMELSKNVMTKAIFQDVNMNSKLTYGQMGRVVMMILGFGKLSNESSAEIVRCFGWNFKWRTFVKELIGNTALEIVVGSEKYSSPALRGISLFRKFYEALEDTYLADWKSEPDYISPTCLLYMIERLLFMVSYSQGYFFTTRSTIVELLISQEWMNNPTTNLVGESSLDFVDIHNFIVNLVHDLLLNKSDTLEWTKSTESSSEDYFPLLVLRLIVLLSVLCVNSRKDFDKLFGLLYMSEIGSQLPRAFCDAICRRDCYFVDALADALSKIENPLVVVVNGDELLKFSCSGAILLNLKVEKSREDLLRELFPQQGKSTDSRGAIRETDSCDPLSDCSYGPFSEMLLALDFENGKGGNAINVMFENPKIKVEVDRNFQLLSSAMDSFPESTCEDEGNLLAEANSVLDDLKRLSASLDKRQPNVEDTISTISEIMKRLHLRWPRLEPLLNHLLREDEDIYHDCEDMESSFPSGQECVYSEGEGTEGNM